MSEPPSRGKVSPSLGPVAVEGTRRVIPALAKAFWAQRPVLGEGGTAWTPPVARVGSVAWGVRRGAQCRPRIGSSPSASLSTGCQVPRFHSRLSGLRSQPGCRGSVHRYEGLRWVPGHWEWGRKKSRRIHWGWGVSPRGGRGGGEKMRCTHSLCFASSFYCFSQFNNEIFQTHKRGLKNNRGFTHQPTTQLGK